MSPLSYDFLLFGQEDVTQLQIPVYNSLLVKVFQSQSHLMSQVSHIHDCKWSVTNQLLHRSFVAVFREDVQVVVVIKATQELHDAWVIQATVNNDFVL